MNESAQIHDSPQLAEDRPPINSARTRNILQHFEYACVIAVSALGQDAYPAEIARYLSKTNQRRVSLAQVFVALERLEDKGLVISSQIVPSPVRGGRRRRLFQLEPSGVQALRNTAAIFRMSPSTVIEETLDEETGDVVPSPA
jgi:DNA-binding PadR family transcriptional regulator